MMIFELETLFFFFVELVGEDEVLLAEEFVVFFEEVDFVEEGEVLAVFDEHGIFFWIIIEKWLEGSKLFIDYGGN